MWAFNGNQTERPASPRNRVVALVSGDRDERSGRMMMNWDWMKLKLRAEKSTPMNNSFAELSQCRRPGIYFPNGFSVYQRLLITILGIAIVAQYQYCPLAISRLIFSSRAARNGSNNADPVTIITFDERASPYSIHPVIPRTQWVRDDSTHWSAFHWHDFQMSSISSNQTTRRDSSDSMEERNASRKSSLSPLI